MYVAGKNFLTTQKKQLNSNSKAASPQQWKKDFPLDVGAPLPLQWHFFSRHYLPGCLFLQLNLTRGPNQRYHFHVFLICSKWT